MNLFGFKKNLTGPKTRSLAERMDRLKSAMAAGVRFEDALQQCSMTPQQYGYALLQADPKLRALLDGQHAKKMQRPRP